MLENDNQLSWEIIVYPLYRYGFVKSPFTAAEFKKKLLAMLAVVNKKRIILKNVEIYLVNDNTQAAINTKYLACKGPTNIISFPNGFSGTLILSMDTFLRECLLYGQEAGEHLLRLLAHGIAHLAGYDHGPDMDILCAECMAKGRAVV